METTKPVCQKMQEQLAELNTILGELSIYHKIELTNIGDSLIEDITNGAGEAVVNLCSLNSETIVDSEVLIASVIDNSILGVSKETLLQTAFELIVALKLFFREFDILIKEVKQRRSFTDTPEKFNFYLSLGRYFSNLNENFLEFTRTIELVSQGVGVSITEKKNILESIQSCIEKFTMEAHDYSVGNSTVRHMRQLCEKKELQSRLKNVVDFINRLKTLFSSPRRSLLVNESMLSAASSQHSEESYQVIDLSPNGNTTSITQYNPRKPTRKGSFRDLFKI